MFRVILCMSPLEKKYHSPLFTPVGSTCVAHIFQKKTFSSGLMYSILSIDATNFLNII